MSSKSAMVTLYRIPKRRRAGPVVNRATETSRPPRGPFVHRRGDRIDDAMRTTHPSIPGGTAAPAATESTAASSNESHPARGPVSLTQQSSLLMAPHNPSREFMSWVYQLNGRLDVPALAQALDDLVEAHEVLRTVFVTGVGGEGAGIPGVGPGMVPPLAAVQALAAAVRAVEAEYRDLSPWDEPRLSATLYRVAPKTHVLSIFVAEALVDGESGTLVAAELSRAYARHAGRQAPDLPLPSEASYLRWVLDNPVSEQMQERAVEHWRRLRDEPAAPGFWPTSLDEGGLARSRLFNVPAAHWQHLVDSTPGMAAMPFVVVLSWLEMALARVVGAERFVVTSAVSNRSRGAAKDIIGNFVGPVRLLAEMGAG